ncbi:hypothetical protein [Psychrobacter sp. P11G5]|uniref:hypothetical protein n=1 Tax=unclassified Psychrobacter TaxID=196806 RepID=UPI000AA7FD2B|nr:hypothetical protein [Psychrobacter sp. P11G5]
MDWLKSILESLPLEKLSDILGEIVIWWSQMVKNVPPADLPMYAYLGGSIVVLLLWILVARMLPRPLGGMSWMVLFAVLLAPGTALSDPSVIAPASISVVYAIMMKDTATAITNALPILVVLVVGLFVGFVWQLIRGAFDSSLDKARRRSAEDAQANMQLATGNYIEEKNSEPLPVNIPVTTKPSNNDAMNAKQEINLKKQSSNDNIDKRLSTTKPSTQVDDGSVDSDKKL